jgi:hypothetical protein
MTGLLVFKDNVSGRLGGSDLGQDTDREVIISFFIRLSKPNIWA